MVLRFSVIWLLLVVLAFVSLGFAQGKKPMANQFSVHIFSSASILGYVEPCG